MFGNSDREERLAWIGEYLGIKDLVSMTDLTDDQLGAVAGEMKRLLGLGPGPGPRGGFVRPPIKNGRNVVQGEFGRTRDDAGDGESETVFLSSPELVYTMEKLLGYIDWEPQHKDTFLKARFGTANLRMFTFRNATSAVNQLLHIAAHRDLKKAKGEDEKVSRKEINKYIPALKRKLRIDQ
jgi:hypothetical protein